MKCFKQIIRIAHNAKAQFILKYIVKKTEITEEPLVILNGTKIIVITIGHTKFIDSVNSRIYRSVLSQELRGKCGAEEGSGVWSMTSQAEKPYFRRALRMYD